VLREKKCYPQGCTYFRWKCANLNKGKPCKKKYKHVGRACFSCRFFYDVKEINQPVLLLTEEQFKLFLVELEEFEDWLMQISGKQVAVTGNITSVKPQYFLHQGKKSYKIVHNGFFITLYNCSINFSLYSDALYVPIPSVVQNKHRFTKGDMISFNGYVTVKNGMLFINNMRHIEMLDKKDTGSWTDVHAKIAQWYGAILPYQSAKCHACDKGMLLQVLPIDNMETISSRLMFCIEGVSDPASCWYKLHKSLDIYTCPQDFNSYANSESTNKCV
jgi:hypothetical protein